MHVSKAFLCCFYQYLKFTQAVFFAQNDALNVKLLQKEIETYLDGSKHKR